MQKKKKMNLSVSKRLRSPEPGLKDLARNPYNELPDLTRPGKAVIQGGW